MHSTQATFGDEFVPTEMASNVIEIARVNSNLLSSIPSSNIIDMPSNPYTMPVEGADPTFYVTPENTNVPGTDVTKSKAGTGLMTFSAKKFSASVYISGELDDDAKIAGGIRSYVEQKIGKAYGELVDKALINGDTATGATGNVNSDDEAPTAGTYYLAFDGLIKKAFTDSKTNNAGTLDSGDFIKLRSLLGKKGADPSKLAWIMNLETYYKMLNLAQVETVEKFGGAATIQDGVLKSIYGSPVIVNGDFGLAEADGKQSFDTPANNTLGRMLCVYTPGLYVGFKRRLKLNLEYLPRVDQFVITAHVRMDFQTSETGCSALGFNITV